MAGLFGWSLVNSRFLIVLSRRRHFQHISYLASIYISHDPGHSGPFILLFYITKKASKRLYLLKILKRYGAPQ